MRVLALAPDAFGGDGGIARFTRDLILALAGAPPVEHIDVLCRHSQRRPEATPQHVVQHAGGGGRAAFAVRALGRAATTRYDLVLSTHVHLAPIALAAAAMHRAPCWLHVHGIEVWQRPGPLRHRAVHGAKLITASSRYTRARLLEWAAIDPQRIRVLPCTVDARFTPGPKPVELAARLGVAGRRILLTVSRIDRGDRYKGHEQVIRALQRLAPRRPALDYVVVGDGEDRARLEQFARDCGVGPRVHFAGQVSDSDLLDYYRLADVFVMPSSKEGFGIVFLEAACVGVPVIAGGRDGSADALADAPAFAAPPPGDEALAHAIEQMLDAPPRAPRLSRFAAANFAAHARALLAHTVGAGTATTHG